MLNEEEKLPSLAELAEKIEAAKKAQEPKPIAKASDTKMVARAGVELISGAIAGCFVGYYLDKWLDTSPFLFIIMFFCGCGAGFFAMLKAIENNEKREINSENITQGKDKK